MIRYIKQSAFDLIACVRHHKVLLRIIPVPNAQEVDRFIRDAIDLFLPDIGIKPKSDCQNLQRVHVDF